MVLAIVPWVVAPGPFSALASAAQAAGVLITDIRERNQQAAIQVAEESIGDLAPEEFLQRLVHDERLTVLFNKAVRAALETPTEAKRRAMGRVVGAALTDDAEIDQSVLMLEALIDLEAPHFATLAKINAAETFGKGAAAATKAGDAVEAGLRRHGLIQDAAKNVPKGKPMPPIAVDSGIGVTDVGKALVVLVSEPTPTWSGQDWGGSGED